MMRTKAQEVELQSGPDDSASILNRSTAPDRPFNKAATYNLDMGIKNAGFVPDTKSNRASSVMQSRAFSPYAVDTPVPPTYELMPHGEGTPEGDYLKPVDGSSGHQYEDLPQVVSQVSELNKSSGPRKKTNVVYEPAEIKNGRPAFIHTSRQEKNNQQYPYKISTVPRCMLFVLLLVAVIAILALIIAILVYRGVISNDDNCSCSQGVAERSTGKDTRIEDLVKKIQQLQSNLTLLQNKLEPQVTDIAHLKNASALQENTISLIEGRVNDKGKDIKELRETVLNIKKNQQDIQVDIRDVNISAKETRLSLENIEKRIVVLQMSLFTLKKNISTVAAVVENNVALLSQISGVKSDLTYVERNLTRRIDRVSTNLNSSINLKVALLEKTDETLFMSLERMNMSVLNEIRNISLTPGPRGQPGLPGKNGSMGLQGIQGPQGVGNLSLCRVIEKEGSSGAVQASDIARATTVVKHEVSMNYVAMGATCSTKNGRRTIFEDRGSGLYACTCKELPAADSNGIHCQVFIWECPISA